MEQESERSDGKVIVSPRGTLSFLEEWVGTKFTWEDVDEAVKMIVNPLREVRRLRQNPAHKVEENKYAEEYETEQHRIFCAVYGSVSQLRYTLAKHPSAPQLSIPTYLEKHNIVFY